MRKERKEMTWLEKMLYFQKLMGRSETLIGSDSEPYIYRASPSIGDYNAMHDEIVGASVGWNQLCKSNNDTTEINGITITNNGDGSFSVNGTATAEVRFYIDKNPLSTLAIGSHKAVLLGCPQGGSLSTYFLAYLNGGGGLMDYANSADIGSGKVLTVHNSGFQTGVIVIKNGTTVNNLKFKPQFVDLTQMLGTTIADHIYTLEQGTAGAGVSFFRKYFGSDYYAYDSGSIKSVEGLSEHIMRDSSDNIIGNYPLDNSLTLRGLLKLDNGKLKADGDVYKASGEVVRDYGKITVSAFASFAGNGTYGTVNLPNASPTSGVAADFVSTKFTPNLSGVSQGNCRRVSGVLYLYFNEGTTQTDALAMVNGMEVVYELATPTTESAQPYAKTQKVSSNGTEEYVASGFNHWDEEWEVGGYSTTTGEKVNSSTQIRCKNLIPIMPNTAYCFTCLSARVSQINWYNENGGFISNTPNASQSAFVSTSPSNAHFVAFQCPTAYGTSYKNDVCINVSDASRNGTYQPYGAIVPVGHNTEYVKR